MTDYYYKFLDQQTMLAALEPLGMTYTDPDTNELRLSQGSHQYAAWEVGQIPGIDGWHLNVRKVDPELDLSTLEPFQVNPAQPVCRWA